ncbi:MAG: tyrosine--tRNA ligase [Candidatus Altimarinota bacterium]
MAASKKTSTDSIQQITERGVVDLIVKEELIKKLQSGKKLRIKFGIDPTGADLHLGHMVPLRKLGDFQKAGHQIVLIFGNFTGQIGDPTGKTTTRVPKTQAELEKNAKHYLEQAKFALDVDKVEVTWNADWLGKLNFSDILNLCSQFTVAQMLERDMFQERIRKDQPISVHEFMYPLMQGYDSVQLKADVEIGGTDQLFNMLAGRPLQKAFNQPSQSVVTVPLLVGTDGKIKMSKSENNYIGVKESAGEIYGKTMSVPDHCLINYFELATNLPLSEIKNIEKSLQQGENPRNIKMRLAKEIVTIYHSAEAAEQAEQQFIKVFSKGDLPDQIETIIVKPGTYKIQDLLSEYKLVNSKSEARRLIEGGGVKVNQQKITDLNLELDLTQETLIQAGKRKFIKFKS